MAPRVATSGIDRDKDSCLEFSKKGIRIKRFKVFGRRNRDGKKKSSDEIKT